MSLKQTSSTILEYQPHQTLIEACRKGDPLAQHQLFHAYVEGMYQTAFRIMQQQYEAEDAVQEAFVKAFTKLNGFRGDASFGSWLKRIVVNTALNKIKKSKLIWVSLSDEEHQIADVDTTISLEDEGPSVEEIKKHIAGLPKACQLVFTLHLLEEYPQKEVAEMLNISIGTVKSQYSRAKKLLYQQLNSNV